MPIHDWTRLSDGDFHHFHQCWVVGIGNALNSGLLPPGYLAMAEQVAGRPIPDVVTLQHQEPSGELGGVATAIAPPTARVIARFERINIVASFLSGDLPTAYVESVGLGDPLPSLPIFLSETRYIPAPLEATYHEAWAVFPALHKELIETDEHP